MMKTAERPTTIGHRIKLLREERGWSQARLAAEVRSAAEGAHVPVSQQSIDQLESGKSNQSRAIVFIAKALGVPPEYLATGRGSSEASDSPHGIHRKVEPSAVERHPVRAQASGLVMVRELDIRARAGSGGGLIDVDEATEAEATVAEYGFPSTGFRALYGAEPDRVRIIEVVGDSMEPTLFPGQKVMVDTQDRAPTPPGIFVVFDGLGLVLKRVQFVPDSDPPMVRITSDNKEYDPYQRPLGEAHIQGRVVGFWRRM